MGVVVTVAALILASGLSRRFGDRNKLLIPVEGEALVRRTVRAYLDADLPVWVVVGYQADLVTEALACLAVTIVQNPEFEMGQSRSVRRGLAALPPDATAALIGVGDQPFLTSDIVRAVATRYLDGRPSIVATRYGGQRGSPTLFDRALWPEMMQIEGDRGGRDLLKRNPDRVAWVDTPDARPGADVDSPDDLDRLGAE